MPPLHFYIQFFLMQKWLWSSLCSGALCVKLWQFYREFGQHVLMTTPVSHHEENITEQWTTAHWHVLQCVTCNHYDPLAAVLQCFHTCGRLKSSELHSRLHFDVCVRVCVLRVSGQYPCQRQDDVTLPTPHETDCKWLPTIPLHPVHGNSADYTWVTSCLALMWGQLVSCNLLFVSLCLCEWDQLSIHSNYWMKFARSYSTVKYFDT